MAGYSIISPCPQVTPHFEHSLRQLHTTAYIGEFFRDREDPFEGAGSDDLDWKPQAVLCKLIEILTYV